MLPENLASLRVVDLKEELSKRGLPLKGKKDELIARLQQWRDEQKQEELSAPAPEALTDAPTTTDQKAADLAVNEQDKAQDNQPAPAENDEKPQTVPQNDDTAVKEPSAVQHAESVPEAPAVQEKDAKQPEDDADRGTKRKRSVDVGEQKAKAAQPEKRPKPEVSQVQTEAAKETETDKQEQPAENNITSSAIYIKGFVRPLIVRHVQELIGQYGTAKRFWMDAIKTHCYVIYESTEQAKAAFGGIDGIVFPRDTGRKLSVGGLTPQQAEVLIEQEQSAADRRIKIDWEGAIESVIKGELKQASQSPSSNSPEARRPRLFGISQITRELQKAATASVLASENSSAAAVDERPTSLSQQHYAEGSVLVAEEQQAAAAPPPPPPTASLDELFRKTKTAPHLYYLPVADDIAQKRLEKLRQQAA